MSSLLHIFAMCTITLCFLRLGNLEYPPPIGIGNPWVCQKTGIKYLGRWSHWIFPWYWEQCGGFIKLKGSYQTSSLAWWCGLPFWQHWFVMHFVLPHIFSPIIGHNAALSLLYCSIEDTWQWLGVQPASIVITRSVGEMYHPLYCHLPLHCIDFMKG